MSVDRLLAKPFVGRCFRGSSLYFSVTESSTRSRLLDCYRSKRPTHLPESLVRQSVTAYGQPPLAPPSSTGLLLTGLGWGIATGLIEAAGLLLFQRINWARWGPMMHVSKEIFWISPIVDGCFLFTCWRLICLVVVRLAPRFPAVRALAFLLAFLSVYDWLTLTNRLSHRACLLLSLGSAVAFVRWCGKRESAFLQFFRRAAPLMVAAWVLVFAGIQGGNGCTSGMRCPTCRQQWPGTERAGDCGGHPACRSRLFLWL